MRVCYYITGGGMFFCTSIAFLLCILLIPLVIVLCKKYNWYDEVDSRKVHQGQIPRLGGVGIFLSFFVAMFVYVFFFSDSDLHYAVPAFVGGFIVFFFGILDDFMNLRAKFKFLVQIVSALIVALGPLYFKDFLGFQIPVLLGRSITFFWILFLVNAYNLIDGLDLLCGGLSFLTLLTSGILMNVGQQPVGNIYLILCASIFGFLVFNRPPARIFLGDGGSQTLGFAIAMTPLFPLQGPMEHTKILVALLLVSIPFTDVIAAVWRRTRAHRSFFAADRAHIHHKFVNIGFSKTMTAVCLVLIQLCICLSALATLAMSRTKDVIVLLCVCIGLVWSFFIMMHYINRTVNTHHTGHLADAPQEEH